MFLGCVNLNQGIANAIEQTLELVILDVMRLMWRHWNAFHKWRLTIGIVIEIITSQQLKNKTYRNLYFSAFPADGLAPLEQLLRRSEFVVESSVNFL